MTTDQACQKQFLDKSSVQHEIRRFFSTHILLSLQNFSTYCTVFLKLRYRDIVTFRTKYCMDEQEKLVVFVLLLRALLGLQFQVTLQQDQQFREVYCSD